MIWTILSAFMGWIYDAAVMVDSVKIIDNFSLLDFAFVGCIIEIIVSFVDIKGDDD